MINQIGLIRNIGAFDSVDTGTQLPLNKFSFIYAENGRGKTTLSSILRSFSNGDPIPILERRRLGSAHPPHVVITTNGGHQAVFQNGKWSDSLPDIVIFDDHFVSENICSGMQVETVQRQKLHEFIIGSQGVNLNAALQEHVLQIENHNRELHSRGNAIPAALQGGLSLDEFCSLEAHPAVDKAILDVERNLAAATQANKVNNHTHFTSIDLPEFNITEIASLLDQQLPDLEAEALLRVQEHFTKLGVGGENWVHDGVEKIPVLSASSDIEACPLCAQDLANSPLISHYQAYFSEAYRDLNQSISNYIQQLSASHSGHIQAAFERAYSTWTSTGQFWANFTEIPPINLDTAAIVLAWREAYESILVLIQTKQLSPLERYKIGDDIIKKVRAYDQYRNQVLALSQSLVAMRIQIDIVKEQAAAGNVEILQRDLALLRATQARYRTEIAPLCKAYLQEKQSKTETETLRDAARTALDQYRQEIFPKYQALINDYLRRFNAGFRLDSVASRNTRAGSDCRYNVLINKHPVSITAREEGQPSFKTTLSSGDRNTLALAFFFASIENDPNRNRRVVVIDDPMTSLDEHRSLTTIQEIRRLANDVAQVNVLSHSKSFLSNLWKNTDTAISLRMSDY